MGLWGLLCLVLEIQRKFSVVLGSVSSVEWPLGLPIPTNIYDRWFRLLTCCQFPSLLFHYIYAQVYIVFSLHVLPRVLCRFSFHPFLELILWDIYSFEKKNPKIIFISWRFLLFALRSNSRQFLQFWVYHH